MKRIVQTSTLSARNAVGAGILLGTAVVSAGLLATGSDCGLAEALGLAAWSIPYLALVGAWSKLSR